MQVDPRLTPGWCRLTQGWCRLTQALPQVDPGACWFQLLKLEHDKLPSNFAFDFNLRPYAQADVTMDAIETKTKLQRALKAGRCRFTVSKHVWKAPEVSALEAQI